MKLLRKLRSLLRKGRLEAEMADEMRYHVELQTELNVKAGMNRDEARYTALRQFGNVASIQERARDVLRCIWLEQMTQDVRFAGRQLRRNPSFVTVAVFSLALGIAANTTIFSFINALLLRPPPVEEPQGLWQIWRWRPHESSEMRRYGVWSRPEIAYLRAHNKSLRGVGAFDSEPTLLSWNRNGLGEPIQSLFVTGNFFDLCGIRPELGRFFLPEEDLTPGTHPVVVVSHGFWQSQLNADPRAVGRVLTINGVALTIVGIAPREFTGVLAGISPDLWVPFMMVPAVRHNSDWLTRNDWHSAIGIGRLNANVSRTQAATELTMLTRAFEDEIRGDRKEDGAVMIPSQLVPAPLRGYVRTFTGMLMGAVFLVLLIACANAANLQLARSVVRRQEIAVRSALGAGRRRLIRQLLTESTLLAMLGGGLGFLASIWLTHGIGWLMPTNLPIRLETGLDWRVLAFTTIVSLLTGIIFGWAPAMRGTRLDLVSTLKDESHGAAMRRSYFASFLIIGQMSLCLILLLAAALCLRSLFNARALDPGFSVEGRVAAGINLGDYDYSEAKTKEFFARLTTKVETLPGVHSAALTAFLPLGTEQSNGSFQLEGREMQPRSEAYFFNHFSVSPGYFATMGTRVLTGREFTTADRPDTPLVAVINEVAALRYWPGENPIGRRLFVGDPKPENAREIVGVVQTGRYRSLGEEPTPAFFECFNQASHWRGTLVAQVQDNPVAALAAIRRAAQELDPRLALTDATTLEKHLSLALFPIRTAGLMLGLLGVVALVLAVSGLFGVIAYSVTQRTREVGIRMALGARPGDVLRLVLRQGLSLSCIGIGVGLVGGLAVTRLLRSLLYGISPTDPVTFLIIPCLLLLVAWLACWLPAWRASRVDPLVALRAE